MAKYDMVKQRNESASSPEKKKLNNFAAFFCIIYAAEENFLKSFLPL